MYANFSVLLIVSICWTASNASGCIADVSFSCFQRLPPAIGGLKKLRVLDLEENKLELLPPEIGSRSMLVFLLTVTEETNNSFKRVFV
jgi:hypothetical protein